jgi:single-stranded DNA-binding protein
MSIECAFLGTLGKDAEAKTSTAGRQYLRANVRVGDGERAQWVNVTAFDADAIATADKFVKGAPVYVEGRITLDKWKSQAGEDRSGLSCMSWHCRLAQIGRNKVKRKNGVSVAAGIATPTQTAQAPTEFDDEIPW